MNILLFSRGVPTKRDPQWGCFEKDQAEALVAAGHKVTVVAVDTRFRWFWRSLGITYTQANGVDYYNFFLIPGAILELLFGTKFYPKIKLFFWKKVVARAISQHGLPDVIYSHYLSVSRFAVDVARDYRLPVVAIEHWSELNKDVLLQNVKKLGNYTYPRVDCLLAVSGSLQKRLREHFGAESQIVYNTIGNEFIYSTPKCGCNDKLIFTATGSLIYRKGYDLLIAAFNKLNLPKDSWQLNIVGEGEERAQLQRQIDETNLQENIHLVGKKNKTEIVELLQQSDVFVLASRMETFSVATIEALACGLPVVATACGGPQEIVQKTDGILIEPNSVDALVQAIKTMIKTIDTYDRKQIAANCCSRFAPEVIAKQLTEIFEQTVEKYNQVK